MIILYNILLGIYWGLLNFAALFNPKAKQFVQGRKGVFSKLSSTFQSDDSVYWFHAASLGEFEQGRPVIEELKKQKPEAKILVTFFSPSGYEIRKNYQGADCICYLPMDFSWNAKKMMCLVNPKTIYFIKYEFWHNYISEAYKLQIPVYCFSANFRQNQLFFKWYGGWYRNVLRKMNHLFVQTQRSKDLLSTIGITDVTVTGDTRFDRVHQIASQTKELPIIEKFKADKNIIIAGSSWPVDEAMLVNYINQCTFDCKFIIAPHELHESNIELLQKTIERKSVRYSKFDDLQSTEYQVLIIDNIGMLSSIYKYGIAAYIGGGFGKGLHNILEAATFGLPILIGPNHTKFQEALDLVEREGVFPINNASEMKVAFDRLLGNTEHLTKASQICKTYVAENIGATGKILEMTLL